MTPSLPPSSDASHTRRSWPSAVIAGAYQTGVLAVRTLQRRGVHAVMFDSIATNPGFKSVYGAARLCPDPDTDPDGWLQFMLRLAGELRERAVLIASSDKFVTAIARHETVLREHFVFSRGAVLQGALADKLPQYQLAAEHGMPMPLTQFVTSAEEAREFCARASFPCLMKPTHFREWERLPPSSPMYRTKVAIAETPERLLENYRDVSAVTPTVVAQEIIQGPDTAKRVYLSCYDAGGRRIAHAMFRELRCDPLGFGPASISEPVVDAEADEVCDRFLRQIGYSGICEIEVKRDTRDGRVKLIEANPRLSGGGDAAPYAGVDLCWIHYCDLIGDAVEPVGPRGNDFRHIVLRADGSAIPSYWKAGLLSWRDIRQSYRAPRAYYDLDPRDWRYSVETVYVAAMLMIRGVWRNLFGKADATDRTAFIRDMIFPRRDPSE
jgi:D-aspartate ligase